MIIATPRGEFFSEGASELDNYKWKLTKITKETAIHYCQKSHDYIIHRPLTLREWFRVVTKGRKGEIVE